MKPAGRRTRDPDEALKEERRRAEAAINPPSVTLVEEQIEKLGRPTLVVLDMANRMIDQDEKLDPGM